MRLLSVALAVSLPPSTSDAADTWAEIRGQNVTVLANGSTGEARTLAWQLEQIRLAVVQILPWARTDLDRPLLVLAVDSEQKMRTLAPEYWERSGGVRPDSLWVTGADKHYFAIRSDVRAEDRRNINPHVNAYFSYVSLIIQRSLETEMPLWFTRGLAGVLSNTIVGDSFVTVGAPIPWHLQSLRDRSRLLLAQLIAVTPGSRELTRGENLARFDAQTWALVHFLLFGNQGSRAERLNQFFRLVSAGTAKDTAFVEAFGKVEQLEAEYVRYLGQTIFTFAKLPADATVKRERYAERTMSVGEAAAALALFHTAMRRPVEARTAIVDARKSGTPAPDSYVAEGLLLRQEGKLDEAQAALARAVADGSTNAAAFIELVRLRWRANADRETLVELEKLLERATQLNQQDSWGYAMRAELRSVLGMPNAIDFVARAIKLDRSESAHRLTAARILFRAGQREDALKAVQAALTLAASDEARNRARELQETIERQKPKQQLR
jgi:tetratricopeptide (TPR) repeat protein